MALWKRPIHETLEEEEDASDVVDAGSTEQEHDRVWREAPTGGQLPADGSAEEDAVVELVAAVSVVEAELELLQTPLRRPLVCSSSFSSSCWRRALQMELAPTYQVPMELAPSS